MASYILTCLNVGKNNNSNMQELKDDLQGIVDSTQQAINKATDKEV